MVCLRNICVNALHKGDSIFTNNNNNNNNNNSDMGTINSSDRIAATLYCLGTRFVSGMYV
jgi:hypothetical protein